VKPENKEKVIESYGRLLEALHAEIAYIEKCGSSIVPEIDFNDVRRNGKRGVAHKRGSLPKQLTDYRLY
jgi:Protein of unknown function (DUF1479)